MIHYELLYSFVIRTHPTNIIFEKLWHCEYSHIWGSAKTSWTHLTSGWDTDGNISYQTCAAR